MIQHNLPTISIEEELAASNVLKSGWLSQGNEVIHFENEFCNFLNLPKGHAVAVSSGTAALYLSLWVLNSKGKNVAIPSYSCVALNNSIKMIGGESKFIDNEYNSPNIDIADLNDSNCEIAIIPHTYGIPVDINSIKTKFIIEDCCQSLGSIYNGNHTGLNGTIGVFSFYSTKIITSGGQGGMIVSKDKNLIDQIKDYRDFDMKIDTINRFNFQITDLQASIGRVQLSKLPDFLKRRKEIFEMYLNSGLDMEISNYEQNNYRAILKTKEQKLLLNKLLSNNIKSIIPLEESELLKPMKNCINYCNNTLSLPIYPKLNNSEVKQIINCLI